MCSRSCAPESETADLGGPRGGVVVELTQSREQVAAGHAGAPTIASRLCAASSRSARGNADAASAATV